MSGKENVLHIGLVQSNIFWHQAERNRQHLSEILNTLPSATHLVVLPEMFSTGFSMDVHNIAENAHNSPTLQWMQAQAKEKQFAICGSCCIFEPQDQTYRNRLWFVFPDGKYEYYDKRHLFSIAGEHHFYAAGTTQKIVRFRQWRIALNICYDLRFPVWSRLSPNFSYDLLLYVANWPQKRITAWNKLLAARAIENQAYVVGVNRVGTDANEIIYTGNSAAYDYIGEELVQMSAQDSVQTSVANIEIAQNSLQYFRHHFPVTADADNFSLLQ
ncbi:MAG: amidohydrolase [Bacteroidetes bacterium]|nr:amidohydrolase [Bacteroidota bacterium]MCB9042476.1 amidohydrolase [Chitinophagales bacterium]